MPKHNVIQQLLTTLGWSQRLGWVLARLVCCLVVVQWLAYISVLPADFNQKITLAYLAVIFLIKTSLLRRLERFPGGRSVAYRLAIVAGIFAVAFFFILALRLPYARSSLFGGFLLLMIAELLLTSVRNVLEITRYVLVPPAKIDTHRFTTKATIIYPDESSEADQGILVVDTQANTPRHWLDYVVRASVAGRTVISLQQLRETLSGKVATAGLSVGELEVAAPPSIDVFAKRVMDITVGLLLAPIILPIVIVLAVAIRVESPGPALYRQVRIGKGNRPFVMYKLRSMRSIAEPQAKFANQEENRITRLGYFIRATHLDELPQLLNVLKGDMSLVGPRPEQPQFVEGFDSQLPFYRYRHMVRPGITGWAQVCQGYATDTDTTREKLTYDLYYIRHFSLWLDILILARTIRSVLLDRHPGG